MINMSSYSPINITEVKFIVLNIESILSKTTKLNIFRAQWTEQKTAQLTIQFRHIVPSIIWSSNAKSSHVTLNIQIVFVINVKLQLSIDWCYYKANINIFQDLTRPAKQNKPFITFPRSAAWPDDHHSSSRPPPVSACQRCAIQRQSQAPSELS